MPKLGMEKIRRRQLIDAVLHILEQQGWRDLTIREISEVAGVSSGIIAHYFGNKRSMTIDAIAEAHRRLEKLLVEAERAHANPLDRLAAFVDILAIPPDRGVPGWPFWAAIWGRMPFDDAILREAQELQRRLHELLTTAFQEGQRLRLFLVGTGAERVAHQVIALANGLGLQRVLEPKAMNAKRFKESLLRSLGRELQVEFAPRLLGSETPAARRTARD